VAADALDRPVLARAVRAAAPDAVVNLLTAIPAEVDPRHLARDFAVTNRLRTEGTRNLHDAARAAGAERIVPEGLAYAYDPSRDPVESEDDPLWHRPPRQFAPVLDALVELEGLTAGAGGLVLRFGHLYGPGSACGPDGSFTRQVRAGKVPVVGKGAAVFSFTHVHDAATAVAAALDKGGPGVLNVVDDTPVPVHEWLPAMADLLGAPAPRRAPAALARLAVGGWGVAFMTELRGADNTRARQRPNWRPGTPLGVTASPLAWTMKTPPPCSAVPGPGEAIESDPADASGQHRTLLLGLAYQLLGSMWDAEDIVQDAYLRWMSTGRAQVREPRAFLVTMVSRPALDQLRSVRVTREACPGRGCPSRSARAPAARWRRRSWATPCRTRRCT
jgi:nucleoside-diphosphate-sugar epimerase